MPAPSGKDAGSKVWLCHIEIRGRRRAVIGARRFGCNVHGWSTRLRAMDQKLARKNIRSGLIAGVVCFFMFGMTFVAAAIYVS
jgi:hypothetical protein